MNLRNKITGQVSLEFAILTFCIVAALVTTGVYIKRGIQGRLRQTADDIGPLYAPKETTGTSSKVFNQTREVKVYTELGTATLPSGETVKGKFTYRQDDILNENLQEDVDEQVQ